VILISKYIVPRGYIGITIFSFMFLKYKALKESAVLVNYKKINLRQQLELLIIPLLLRIVFNF
jgi:hypothetical protein